MIDVGEDGCICYIESFYHMPLFFLRTGNISNPEELVQIRAFHAVPVAQMFFFLFGPLTSLRRSNSNYIFCLLCDTPHIVSRLD